MRKARLCALAVLLFPFLSGCDDKGDSTYNTGISATPPPQYDDQSAIVDDSPARTTTTSSATVAQVAAAPNSAVPSTVGAGRTFFDGQQKGLNGDPSATGSDANAPAVYAGAPGSGAKNKAAPNAVPRKLSPDNLNPPPPPVVASSFKGGDAGGGQGSTALGPGSLDGASSINNPGGSGSGSCPAGMIAIEGFCIDKYEAPNIPGAKPLAAQTALEAESQCSAQGKRLCTENEWTRACSGPQGLPYPYGNTWEMGRCNDDAGKRIGPAGNIDWVTLNGTNKDAAMTYAETLNKSLPSGAKEACVSPEGVYDLMGNVTEWTRSNPGRQWPHVMKGGFWYGAYKTWGPTCSFVNPAHNDTFRSYEAGFRCCLDRS